MQNFSGVRPEDRIAEDVMDRILARVVVTSGGCWEWQGARTVPTTRHMTRRGWRYCRTCRRERARIAYRRSVGK